MTVHWHVKPSHQDGSIFPLWLQHLKWKISTQNYVMELSKSILSNPELIGYIDFLVYTQIWI